MGELYQLGLSLAYILSCSPLNKGGWGGKMGHFYTQLVLNSVPPKLGLGELLSQ
jgi:hypothetical protein